MPFLFSQYQKLGGVYFSPLGVLLLLFPWDNCLHNLSDVGNRHILVHFFRLHRLS